MTINSILEEIINLAKKYSASTVIIHVYIDKLYDYQKKVESIFHS